MNPIFSISLEEKELEIVKLHETELENNREGEFDVLYNKSNEDSIENETKDPDDVSVKDNKDEAIV